MNKEEMRQKLMDEFTNTDSEYLFVEHVAKILFSTLPITPAQAVNTAMDIYDAAEAAYKEGQ